MKARIITLSSPESNHITKTQEKLIARTEERLTSLAILKPDLVCLPEEILRSIFDTQNPKTNENTLLMMDMVQKKAKELSCYIAVSLLLSNPDESSKVSITTLIYDRNGNIAGKYVKRHDPPSVYQNGHVPGNSFTVIDTDFGKIGFLTCFDIGWREDWETLEKLGADIVVWQSAHDGGALLNAYAILHQYYVVSSVWHSQNSCSRVIDPLGNTISSTNYWDGMCYADICPDARVFHIDNHLQKIDEIRNEYGDQVFIQFDGKANLFLLGTNHSELSLDTLISKYKLLTEKDYRLESDRLRLSYLKEHS